MMERRGPFLIGFDQPETVTVTLTNVAHWQELERQLAELDAELEGEDPAFDRIDEERANLWQEMAGAFRGLIPELPTPAAKFEVIATFDGIPQQVFEIGFMEVPTESDFLFHTLGTLDPNDRPKLAKLSTSQLNVQDKSEILPWLRVEGKPYHKHGQYYFNEHLAK